MTERPGRRNPRVTHARVQRVERLTPHMIRVVLGGPGLAGFPAGRYTDHYIKLLFPAEGVTYPEPFDLQRIRAELPREQWPRMRTYTVRRWDAEACELSVDLLHHGEEGLAGPWAARVRPGDEVRFAGPGGGYAPDPAADWHLLAGDESALPAIAAALERLPEGTRAYAFIEVGGPEEEQKLDISGGVSVTWLHRGDARVGDALVRAVRDLDFPPGEVQAFVHGEAGFVRELRRLLRIERGVPAERLSISGYWRAGQDEDGWQAAKREWNRRIEEEQEKG
ncbi:siderophore-interacting protein [Planomonospora venezuelensis]|uniref:NADPH-dependent ferric siderophore reductase n=1 Tax=Planomonospora venezuelensis TaxID=1999 RepID=A0A841DF63_PLAVE|nr:siderophore-interacting protein [Planomonospora venezuelensis]MBB5967393.1 NADPH-dependent ferric siderophore reductase [Planomonospora venezuelensis]GIN05311.1 siderophore-interacting protein [Planomonospora venezuelensis]